MTLGTGTLGSGVLGTFPEEDVKTLLNAAAQLDNPASEIKEILTILIDEIRKPNSLSVPIVENDKWRAWIPNTPEKLAAYATIAAAILSMLADQPVTNIVINQEFKTRYEVVHNQIQSNTYYLFENEENKANKAN